MAAERAPASVTIPRSPIDLASRIQADLEASEPAGDDDRPGLWERARAAAMLFYLERTGRAVTDGRRPSSGATPSDEAAAFEIAHPVRVLGITTVGDWQATTKVTLALDPTLSAAQVAAMWQKVRSGVLRQGARGRTVSRKSLALALFVAHHPGRTWADLRRMWNQLYAHWAFKSPDLRVFRNAAVRAPSLSARAARARRRGGRDVAVGPAPDGPPGVERQQQLTPAVPRSGPRTAPSGPSRVAAEAVSVVTKVIAWSTRCEPSKPPRSTHGRGAWASVSSTPSPTATAEYFLGDADLERTWGAFDGERVVGTLRSFPTPFTTPGPAEVERGRADQCHGGAHPSPAGPAERR